MVRAFGDAKFLEAELDVVASLNHRDEQIRCLAVRVLTFRWGLRRHRDEFVRLLRHHPEYEVKSCTAAGIGYVFCNSRDPVASRGLCDTMPGNAEDLY